MTAALCTSTIKDYCATALRASRRLQRVGLVLCAVSLAAQPTMADDTLRLGVTTLPPSQFNPLRYTGVPAAYTWTAVFEGLTSIDENGEVQPHLATSWERIDPLTWIFHLRKDVTFSNGRPFTADAVVTMINFLTSDKAAGENVARMMRFLDTGRAIDEHTVEIKTLTPAPLLPRFVPQLYAVEPEHFTALGLEDFGRDPIATGPFKVDRIDPTVARLSAFKESWRPPKVDRLEIITMADQAGRSLAVQSGQLDIALQLGPDDLRTITARGGKKVAWLEPQVWAYNFIGGSHPALEDVRVREALNLAVDRQAIIDALLDGEGVPATQPAPSMVYGYNPDLPPIPYDPARARELLADAGYGDGFEMVLEATSGTGPSDSAINLTVAQFLGEIGVEVEILNVASSQIIRNTIEGTWKGNAFALSYSYAPTVEVLRAMDSHSCRAIHPWYCNEDVMPLIEAAQTELDPDRNLQLRRDIMAFYRNDWASLMMFEESQYAGTAGNVTGLAVVNNVVSYDQIGFE